MADNFILAAVKETSKGHEHLSNFEELCREHAELVEKFLSEMKRDG